MIDINNKKFNFYDPVTIVDNDKEDLIFSETLYILSEKYIPSRENKMIMNQFENLVINHNNTEEKQTQSPTKQPPPSTYLLRGVRATSFNTMGTGDCGPSQSGLSQNVISP